jgi:hypothetical protein
MKVPRIMPMLERIATQFLLGENAAMFSAAVVADFVQTLRVGKWEKAEEFGRRFFALACRVSYGSFLTILSNYFVAATGAGRKSVKLYAVTSLLPK